MLSKSPKDRVVPFPKRPDLQMRVILTSYQLGWSSTPNTRPEAGPIKRARLAAFTVQLAIHHDEAFLAFSNEWNSKIFRKVNKTSNN